MLGPVIVVGRFIVGSPVESHWLLENNLQSNITYTFTHITRSDKYVHTYSEKSF